MIRLVSDTIDRNDINSLIEWLSQEPIPRLTKGELTWELEKKWAKKIGTKYSVFVNSGSSAILLTLAAIKEAGINKNNKIVVPALSWVTDISSPILLGYNPILCDCNLTDLSCDLVMLEKIFKEHNPAVFISVAPLGLVPNMKELIELCEKYDVYLLEDICESMGSKYKGQYLGSFGYASVYSMYFGHHLSTIEGGFINTNNKDFYYMLLMMRSHGWDRDLPEEIQETLRLKYGVTKFESLYNFYAAGMNVRSTDLQAYIGIKAIDKLDKYSEIRRENFNIYNKLIKNNKLNIDVSEIKYISSFAYPMVHEKRNEIIKELEDNEVEVRPLIAGNMANKPFWYERYGKQDNLPNAEMIDKQGFYLPNHQDLREEEIRMISNIINNYV